MLLDGRTVLNLARMQGETHDRAKSGVIVCSIQLRQEHLQVRLLAVRVDNGEFRSRQKIGQKKAPNM